MSLQSIAVIDMGGTNLKSGLFSLHAEIQSPCDNTPVDSSGDAESILGTKGTTLRNLCADHVITAVVVSTPGPFNYKDGKSLMTEKYVSIHGISLRHELQIRAGLDESIPITFLSDANAYLLGEYMDGSVKGFANCAAVTLGTGLGFSVIKNHRILVNENGRPYEALGQTAFNGKPLESFVSGRGLETAYYGRTGIRMDARTMAFQMDPIALELYNDMGNMLGEALAPRAERYEFKHLVIGGGIANSLHLFIKALNESMPEVQVVQAKHIIDAALYGAAYYSLGLSIYEVLH